MPHTVTMDEVRFLEEALDLSSTLGSPSRVLDVPVGHGRHAVELARRGHRVTGVDLSREFLDRAKLAAAEANVQIDWRLGDMRDLPWNAEFDAAYCFGNSFGYMDHAGAHAFLSALAKALKPGGRIAIETGVAAESILPTLRPQRWHRMGDLVVLSEPRYVPEESRLDIDYTFIQNGTIETRPAASYVFTTAELLRMLTRAGFESLKLLGGLSGERYQLGSPRLIITARSGIGQVIGQEVPPGSSPPSSAT